MNLPVTKMLMRTAAILMAACTGALYGCNNDDDVQPAFSADFDGSPYLASMGTGKFLSVKAGGEWRVTVSYPGGSPSGWCTASPATGSGDRNVWIKTTRNTGEDQRVATITVTYGEQNISNELVQYGTVMPVYTRGLEMPAIVDTAWLLDYPEGKFMLEYAPTKKHSKWVAWPLYRSCMGSSGRTDAWSFDSRIPDQYTPTRADFYGYDRGHMCPSADRTHSAAMNRPTFFYSNMSPQVGVGFNQDIWADLETRERVWASNINDTIYICAGGTVLKESDIDHYTSPSRMAVPKYFFKVVLRKKSPNGALDAIGFWFENRSYGVDSKVTYDNTRTVRWIEQQTGIDFFYNLNKATQDVVENQRDPAAWGIN